MICPKSETGRGLDTLWQHNVQINYVRHPIVWYRNRRHDTNFGRNRIRLIVLLKRHVPNSIWGPFFIFFSGCGAGRVKILYLTLIIKYNYLTQRTLFNFYKVKKLCNFSQFLPESVHPPFPKLCGITTYFKSGDTHLHKFINTFV